MTIDQFQISLDATYAAIGVPAVITLVDTEAGPVSVTAIDKTVGVEVGDGPYTKTVRPVAAVRVSELTKRGVERVMLPGATITLNGATWRIDADQPKPSPRGEQAGELYLLLLEE